MGFIHQRHMLECPWLQSNVKDKENNYLKLHQQLDGIWLTECLKSSEKKDELFKGKKYTINELFLHFRTYSDLTCCL